MNYDFHWLHALEDTSPLLASGRVHGNVEEYRVCAALEDTTDLRQLQRDDDAVANVYAYANVSCRTRAPENTDPIFDSHARRELPLSEVIAVQRHLQRQRSNHFVQLVRS